MTFINYDMAQKNSFYLHLFVYNKITTTVDTAELIYVKHLCSHDKIYLVIIHSWKRHSVFFYVD